MTGGPVDSPSEQIQDRLEVRILTLCDHAALPPDGKLYLHGAGVDHMYVPTLPGQLGPLFLVLRLDVPWHLRGEQHVVKIRALDADRKPISVADPIAETTFEIGKPAGARPGDEGSANLVFGLSGLPIQEQARVYFHVFVDETSVGVVSVRVQQFPPPTMALLA